MKDFIEEVIKDLENVEKILPRDALEGLSKDDKERIAFIIGLACIPTREEPHLTLHDVAKRLRKAGQSSVSEKRKIALLKIADYLDRPEPKN